MSALQIFRFLGFGSYKTAWSMCHRVRVALANEDSKSSPVSSRSMKRSSAVRLRTDTRATVRRRWSRRPDCRQGDRRRRRASQGKCHRARHREHQGLDPTGFVNETVSTKVSLLCTDQGKGYMNLGGRSRTKRSTMPTASTSSAPSTPTRLKASGR